MEKHPSLHAEKLLKLGNELVKASVEGGFLSSNFPVSLELFQLQYLTVY